MGVQSLSLSLQYSDYVRYVEPCFKGTLVQADLDNREVTHTYLISGSQAHTRTPAHTLTLLINLTSVNLLIIVISLIRQSQRLAWHHINTKTYQENACYWGDDLSVSEFKPYGVAFISTFCCVCVHSCFTCPNFAPLHIITHQVRSLNYVNFKHVRWPMKKRFDWLKRGGHNRKSVVTNLLLRKL